MTDDEQLQVYREIESQVRAFSDLLYERGIPAMVVNALAVEGVRSLQELTPILSGKRKVYGLGRIGLLELSRRLSLHVPDKAEIAAIALLESRGYTVTRPPSV